MKMWWHFPSPSCLPCTNLEPCIALQAQWDGYQGSSVCFQVNCEKSKRLESAWSNLREQNRALQLVGNYIAFDNRAEILGCWVSCRHHRPEATHEELVRLIPRRVFFEGQDNHSQKEAQEYHWLYKVWRGTQTGCLKQRQGAIVEYHQGVSKETTKAPPQNLFASLPQPEEIKTTTVVLVKLLLSHPLLPSHTSVLKET